MAALEASDRKLLREAEGVKSDLSASPTSMESTVEGHVSVVRRSHGVFSKAQACATLRDMCWNGLSPTLRSACLPKGQDFSRKHRAGAGSKCTIGLKIGG